MKTVKCSSGLEGWQCKLRDNYANFDEFKSYCDMYNLHIRLGFNTPKLAWGVNPTIQGSTDPSDFKRVMRVKK
jgi:hypothetical protein